MWVLRLPVRGPEVLGSGLEIYGRRVKVEVLDLRSRSLGCRTWGLDLGLRLLESGSQVLLRSARSTVRAYPDNSYGRPNFGYLQLLASSISLNYIQPNIASL